MDELKISVDYYNETQKKLFEKFPNAKELDEIIKNDIKVPKGEFLTYLMFTEQMDRNGFRTYNDLNGRISHRLGDIDDFLSFNNDSIQSKIIGEELMQIGLTERIGVALGLCVVNKIHRLTAADWKKIATASGKKGHKTFDFEIPIASTGSNFIQAENKGSVIDDNKYKRPTVVNHYNDIIEKKDYVRSEEAKLLIPLHQNLYYGTIGVLDDKTNSTAKVWLIDPPTFDIDMNPEKYKLLARLHYYLDEFKNIGVSNRITDALQKRILEIEDREDYLKLNNVPLTYPSPRGYRLYMQKGKTYAIVDGDEALGKIFIIEKSQRSFPYLVAYPKAIMRIMILQNFENILKYEYNPDFINESVQVIMRLSSKEMTETTLPKNLKFVFNERTKYYEAAYFGKVNHSKDGRIFGLLDSENQNT